MPAGNVTIRRLGRPGDLGWVVMAHGECLDFAREAGYKRMKLWTNHPLVEARRIYLSRGFRLIGEEPHHSYGADLVGQVYELDLAG